MLLCEICEYTVVSENKKVLKEYIFQDLAIMFTAYLSDMSGTGLQ